MTLKKQVLELLREKSDRPLKAKDIAQKLGVSQGDYQSFKKLLREMEESGEIYRARKRRYAVPERINLVVGRLQVTRGGHGFVVPDDGKDDVFIPTTELGGAYEGDRVVTRIERRRPGRNPEGSIVKVLERARSQVVGAYHRSGRAAFLVPSDLTMRRDVVIPQDAESGARDGDMAVARIVDWGSEQQDPVGEIIEVLGRPGEPGVDVLAIVHDHELATEFPPEAVRQAEELARGRPGGEELQQRKDFRDVLTFTIDPADAKDHDDALSIERVSDDRYRVGIHIADVSHYVEERSALDLEALNRGTSVYLVDRVIPMLPEPLSADLCSLRPGEDRLTLSVVLELDGTGEVLSERIHGAVIRSQRALSYEEAQGVIDGDVEADSGLRDALRHLRDLSRQLGRRRKRRGGLDFDLPEARVIMNTAGEPTQIQQLLRLETHRLIEEFMLLANETIARRANRKKLPFLYRVHAAPDPDRMEKLREFLSGFGLKLPKNAHRSSRALQKLLDHVEGSPIESIVSTLVLRSMKQARYSAEREDHFGLGSHAYTHFTSPIRRYPDLVVHRIVRTAFLEGRRVPESTAEHLGSVAQQASTRERQAIDAERDSVELKKLEYMERHLGDEFEGTISGVKPFGLFVLLDDVLAEGLVHVSRLEDDYYHYLEVEHALVGESRGRWLRLGDRIQVRVEGVDREARELDLGPVD
ncbi:MAG: ribonuclease R [Gemmatimonadetes bacterium]|uniref:Ribonuclease R n=1 Tax=Candidatus Kutchimonas denitrificans TaxID=3056748 RepID=A0AAE4Z7N4_9BACT|nr:ribonuclease R [Gemmatimonadota bacterium]NIR75294.1 ribonuclease R [Candidatus Kutchimonas denitrificans]NIS00232.1 ribonuclease R [Gemmatimonadota bacterium]NIT65824.1 ribonuclease R [Gemmatimonadota bacterium]NIU53102.1 ribonuclease R [Gemmatimonadota bacterium]